MQKISKPYDIPTWQSLRPSHKSESVCTNQQNKQEISHLWFWKNPGVLIDNILVISYQSVKW
jgi:hypothetical protein